MTDEPSFFNELATSSSLDTQGLDMAMGDLEKVFSRLERLLNKHISGLRLADKVLGGRKVRKSLFSFGLNSIFRLFSSSGSFTGSSQSTNTSNNNRFPASSGQNLSDLGASLQRFIGRNL